MSIFNKLSQKMQLPTREKALPGRNEALDTAKTHFVHNRSIVSPFASHYEIVYLGLGCFWGAEKLFWKLDGVYTTAVGYCGGFTSNPTYEEVCSGMTGHNEVVMVVYDPAKITFKTILKTFFESHDPTQGMRQGNDRGTQYRSGIYATNQAQLHQAQQFSQCCTHKLVEKGFGEVTTEMVLVESFYYAETYHQQYLAKNSDGYCGLKGTGVTC